MRLFLLTTLVMVAFAANSVLNRLALLPDDGASGPAAFALIRLASGALVLTLLAQLRAGAIPWRRPGRVRAVLALAVYMLGFSFAYVTLDAGIGALILFGGVQLTMFAGALVSGERPAALRYLGAAVALAGLGVLFWPGETAGPEPLGFALMAAAGVGWGIYSLIGRRADVPLAETAANFTLAIPLALAVYLVLPDGLDGRGVMLAVASGALTSGLGYALWYAVLPLLAATIAAVAQLTVPIIALAGGIALLGEPVTWRFLLAVALVLGGVGLSLVRVGRR